MLLARRDRVPERMDDPRLDPAEHRQALDGLARLNALSTSATTLAWLIDAWSREIGRPVRVLDVACGGGDTMVALARKCGRSADVVGCDISPTALTRAAELAAARRVAASFIRCDVLADPLPTGFDLITCGLFLHHLDDATAVRLLRNMRDATGSMVVVDDLVRGPVSLGLVWVGCRLVTRSRVVHFDGPASVRAAFTPTELRSLARDAGLIGATVRRSFPCRMQLIWSRE